MNLKSQFCLYLKTEGVLIIGPKAGSKFIQKTKESLCLKYMIDETRGTFCFERETRGT